MRGRKIVECQIGEYIGISIRLNNDTSANDWIIFYHISFENEKCKRINGIDSKTFSFITSEIFAPPFLFMFNYLDDDKRFSNLFYVGNHVYILRVITKKCCLFR